MLSIVIPSYMRNEDLKTCLASIRENSKYMNEIIILTPDTGGGIENIARKFDAVLYNDGSRQNGHRRVSLWALINKGIELAHNDFVGWLNDDCIVMPRWDEVVLRYFDNTTGLVVMRTRGLNANPEFSVLNSLFDIPCANYGFLRKNLGVRFDESYSWFYGDADISLELIKQTAANVIATKENLVIHMHKVDESRHSNEADERAIRDVERFQNKWRYYKYKNGKLRGYNRLERWLETIVSWMRIVKRKMLK